VTAAIREPQNRRVKINIRSSRGFRVTRHCIA
jgi:hypothetical protein